MSKKEAVSNFIDVLSRQGDMFFSSGDTEQDFAVIKGTIDQQGYWSGTRLRYYFDQDMKLINLEERKFG